MVYSIANTEYSESMKMGIHKKMEKVHISSTSPRRTDGSCQYHAIAAVKPASRACLGQTSTLLSLENFEMCFHYVASKCKAWAKNATLLYSTAARIKRVQKSQTTVVDLQYRRDSIAVRDSLTDENQQSRIEKVSSANIKHTNCMAETFF